MYFKFCEYVDVQVRGIEMSWEWDGRNFWKIH